MWDISFDHLIGAKATSGRYSGFQGVVVRLQILAARPDIATSTAMAMEAAPAYDNQELRRCIRF
ncbi:MAG: hypothetical protein WBV69_13395 [Candidatus Sulfotelmatobacter sp.]